MGKRNLEYSESDSELDNYVKKKVKKYLKRKEDRRHRSRDRRDRSKDKHHSSGRLEHSASEDNGGDTNDKASSPDIKHSVPKTPEEPLPSTSATPPTQVDQEVVQILEPDVNEPTGQVLDSEILNILGEDPSVVTKYGKEIQTELAVRFEHLIKNGLPKEIKKELQDKYLPPSNCPVIDAPELNPEIKAAVSDTVLKRDRGIELKQKELGRALTCIGEALTVLMAKEEKDMSVIKLLMDASRLICDCQNADSITRRNFVLFNVKKEMKDQLQKTKIDKFLFGSDLAETLKTAKSISKSGAELKSTPPVSSKPAAKTKPIPGSSQPRNNLNWKAPPPGHRQKGTQRTREPAARSQHASYSRTSQRVPPPSSRNPR